MSARLRVLLVGAGRMGARHAKVIAANERCDLIRVVDPCERTGRAVAEQVGAAWRPELDTLSDVNAVMVAACTEVHHDLAVQILRQGKPLLVEKPLCDDFAACREVVRLADQRDIPLMCGLLERYNPAVMTAMTIVDSPLHMTSVRRAPYASRIRTGVAWDLLVHDIDVALRVFGGRLPDTVNATTGYFHSQSAERAEDVVDAVLRFPGGRLATASASRVDQRRLRTIVITEIDRVVEVDLLHNEVLVVRQAGDSTIVDTPDLVSARTPLETQLDRFLDIVGGDICGRAERRSILPVHHVISSILDTVPVSAVA
ncbi:Gfo/Idh/MocA family protein [Kibdelosporangium aridum]|uniref:Predicted dehydrogenase n=1 Tax=Kibdelosporangium aridum TaxID=2030 RepID=A0A1Y5Y1M2_KIBAR|nr:Gfo/Idh/MocA family oxidoreductase [Kibdelosporangium aridum]SMD22998.1 Predicted dehydrogenase [Kibdelosporangium aridum]